MGKRIGHSYSKNIFKQLALSVVVLAVFLFQSCSDENAVYGTVSVITKEGISGGAGGGRQTNPSEIDLDRELKSLIKKRAKDAGSKKGLDFFILPKNDEFDDIPTDPRNPLTADKVEFGKLLYHEPGLSRDNFDEGFNGRNRGSFRSARETNETYSCASCHDAEAAFGSLAPQAVGAGGEGNGLDRRPATDKYALSVIDSMALKSPTTLNIAWQKNVMWNGQFGATEKNRGTEDKWTDGTPLEVNKEGFEGVESQALGAFIAHRMISNNTVRQSPIATNDIYRSTYERIFGDFRPFGFDERTGLRTNRPVINLALAIAAFERTMTTWDAPFQQWLRGDEDAMTKKQKQGALVFFGKARCFKCHTGPALNSMEFHALGVEDFAENSGILMPSPEDQSHLGRFSFTEREEDRYKFKVPQLYNLKSQTGFMHSHTLKTLKDVVLYKNFAISQNPEVPLAKLAKEFKPLELTADEVEYLVEFLEDGLYDKGAAKRYVPKELPTGHCFPNRDEVSRAGKSCR